MKIVHQMCDHLQADGLPSEVSHMQAASHPNLLKLLHWKLTETTKSQQRLWLVTELCDKGCIVVSCCDIARLPSPLHTRRGSEALRLPFQGRFSRISISALLLENKPCQQQHSLQSHHLLSSILLGLVNGLCHLFCMTRLTRRSAGCH